MSIANENFKGPLSLQLSDAGAVEAPEASEKDEVVIEESVSVSSPSGANDEMYEEGRDAKIAKKKSLGGPLQLLPHRPQHPRCQQHPLLRPNAEIGRRDSAPVDASVPYDHIHSLTIFDPRDTAVTRRICLLLPFAYTV